MSPRPPTRRPDGTERDDGDPRRVAHDQLRDADDGTSRGREPSDRDMRQPHERDESADGARARDVDPVMKQGERDLAAGRVDTDQRHEAVRNYERTVGRKDAHAAGRKTDPRTKQGGRR